MHVVLEHDPLRRMVKAQGRQPVPMRPRPGLASLDETMPQQKAKQLLSCSAEAAHRNQPCPHQVPHRLMGRVRNPNGAQLSRPMELRQRNGIPMVGLHSVARALGDRRWRDHQAFVAKTNEMTINPVATGAGLIAKA
jgi:hypothetical protein